MKINLNKLSQTMCYILRHKPEEYNVCLDKDGWTDINLLIENIKKKETKYSEIDLNSIKIIVEEDNKGRYEIQNNKIRCVYGHSVKEKISKNVTIPPEFLYHGTPRYALENIKEEGLKPQSRQYVHLSEDLETATIVGKRRDDSPFIIKINSLKAFNDGILFYQETNGIWLADYIPTKYLCL